MAIDPEYVINDVSQEDYEQASGGFVDIPFKKGESPQEGDNIMLEIIAGKGEWKTPNVSMLVKLTVVSPGVNKGKTVEIYPGVSSGALGILKTLCKNLGVEDKVITFNEKKQMVIHPFGFEGGRGMGNFVRKWTTPQESGKSPSLVAKLETTQIYPLSAKGTEVKDLGF